MFNTFVALKSRGAVEYYPNQKIHTVNTYTQIHCIESVTFGNGGWKAETRIRIYCTYTECDIHIEKKKRDNIIWRNYAHFMHTHFCIQYSAAHMDL